MGKPYNTKTEPEYQIGTLSALEESNNGKKLWNNGDLDKTGGWSYGTYQIATKDGTMNDYLTHLQKNPNYQGYYNTLQQAGGYLMLYYQHNNFNNCEVNIKLQILSFIKRICNKYNKNNFPNSANRII